MTPPFEPATGNLPPGIHEAAWDEVAARYGYTPHRLRLLAGLKAALDALRAAGCRRAYVDGSFVTSKTQPADFDACWESTDVDPDLLDPVLLTFDDHRSAQKAKYGGELFAADWAADPLGTTFLAFFQHERGTNRPKGIISIDLEALT
jgi:hypothetical protein